MSSSFEHLFFFLLGPLELEDTQHEFGSKLVVIMGKDYHLLPVAAESKSSYFIVSADCLSIDTQHTQSHTHIFPFFFLLIVGLPARGKSYLVKKLQRYLTWLQYDTKVKTIIYTDKKIINAKRTDKTAICGSKNTG